MILLLFLSLTLLESVYCLDEFGGLKLDPDAFLNMTEMVKAHNYKIETHKVTTDDDHILVAFRIWNASMISKNGIPIYMQHGIFCSTEVFIAAGPERGIAYMMADRGYDVWLLNSRGNTHSREHKHYKINDFRYWNFTFEDVGIYDQRAIINYIVNVTKHKKMHVWTHSMGGTQFMAALTLEPEYYRKHIISAVLVGPVIRFDISKSVVIKFLNYTKILDYFIDIGTYEVMVYTKPLSIGISYINSVIPWLMDFVLSLVADETTKISDPVKFGVFFAHYPGGSGAVCLKHLIQQAERPGFFRYRETDKTPLAEYNLTNIPSELPIAIFTGKADLLSTPEASLWIEEKLRKAGKRAYFKTYDHIGHLSALIPLAQHTQILYDGINFMKASEINTR